MDYICAYACMHACKSVDDKFQQVVNGCAIFSSRRRRRRRRRRRNYYLSRLGIDD
jgi:hypothetical protein